MEHEVKEIKINDIFVGDNSRLQIKKEDLADLMESIRRQGLLHAIGVIPLPKNSKKGKKFKIVYGFRRLAAIIKLKRKTIPAKMIEDVENVAGEIILNLSENEHRKNIDAFEFGRYCVELIDKFHYTQKEIAVLLSVPVGRIKTCVDIYQSLPSDYMGQIKTMEHSGDRQKGKTIPATYAQRVVQMKRKFSLNTKDVTEILELIKKDKEMNNKRLDDIMYFMGIGLNIKDAVSRARDCVTRRYEFAMKSDEAKKLEEEYGSLREAILHLIYSTGAISDPRADESLMRKKRGRKKK